MSEVPIVVGLLHGFDGTGHWLNHVLIDRYVLCLLYTSPSPRDA